MRVGELWKLIHGDELVSRGTWLVNHKNCLYCETTWQWVGTRYNVMLMEGCRKTVADSFVASVVYCFYSFESGNRSITTSFWWVIMCEMLWKNYNIVLKSLLVFKTVSFYTFPWGLYPCWCFPYKVSFTHLAIAWDSTCAWVFIKTKFPSNLWGICNQMKKV